MFDFAKLQLFSELAKKRWDIPKEKALPEGRGWRMGRGVRASVLVVGEGKEVETDAAVDGAAGVYPVELNIFKRLDKDAAAEVKFVETLLRIVVVVDAATVRAFVHMDVHRAHVGDAIVGLAVAHNGRNAQPGQDGDLVAHVDGERLVVFPKGLVYMVVVFVLRP